MKVGRGLAEKHRMWTLLSARDGTAHPRAHQAKKVPGGKILGFRYICMILLEFGKDRPTTDQVRSPFARCLGTGKPAEEGSRGNPSNNVACSML